MEVSGAYFASFISVDHPSGSVRNVAQKQATGEEIREAPYFR